MHNSAIQKVFSAEMYGKDRTVYNSSLSKTLALNLHSILSCSS